MVYLHALYRGWFLIGGVSTARGPWPGTMRTLSQPTDCFMLGWNHRALVILGQPFASMLPDLHACFRWSWPAPHCSSIVDFMGTRSRRILRTWFDLSHGKRLSCQYPDPGHAARHDRLHCPSFYAIGFIVCFYPGYHRRGATMAYIELSGKLREFSTFAPNH